MLVYRPLKDTLPALQTCTFLDSIDFQLFARRPYYGNKVTAQYKLFVDICWHKHNLKKEKRLNFDIIQAWILSRRLWITTDLKTLNSALRKWSNAFDGWRNIHRWIHSKGDTNRAPGHVCVKWACAYKHIVRKDGQGCGWVFRYVWSIQVE